MREKPVLPHTEQKWDARPHFRKQKDKEGYAKKKTKEKQEARIAGLNAKPHKKV